MHLTRALTSAAALAVGSAALAEEGTPAIASLLLGDWELTTASEGCEALVTRQVWTFQEDGTFRRTADGRVVRGRWQLAEEGYTLQLSWYNLRLGPAFQRETHQIVSLDGKLLELITPTQVSQGIVIQRERFAAFFHS